MGRNANIKSVTRTNTVGRAQMAIKIFKGMRNLLSFSSFSKWMSIQTSIKQIGTKIYRFASLILYADSLVGIRTKRG